MAEKKISELPGADPLDGTEDVPVVQAGETRRAQDVATRTWVAETLSAYPDSAGQTAGKVAETDGADGWTFIDTPGGGGGSDTGNVLGGDADGDPHSVAVHPEAEFDGSQGGNSGVAIGRGARCRGGSSVAIGHNATSLRLNNESDRCVAVGYNATARSDSQIAIGDSAETEPGALWSISIGRDSYTGNNGAVAIGRDSDAGGWGSVALGYGGSAAATRGVAIGLDASAPHAHSVCLGAEQSTTEEYQVMIGPRDLEITDANKGIVLVDRNDSSRHRIYIDQGNIQVEAL